MSAFLVAEPAIVCVGEIAAAAAPALARVAGDEAAAGSAARDASNSRWRIGDRAREVLEAEFKRERFPSASHRLKLAQALDVEPRRIQVWFQNRRQRNKGPEPSRSASAGPARSQQRGSHVELARPSWCPPPEGVSGGSGSSSSIRGGGLEALHGSEHGADLQLTMKLGQQAAAAAAAAAAATAAAAAAVRGKRAREAPLAPRRRKTPREERERERQRERERGPLLRCVGVPGLR